MDTVNSGLSVAGVGKQFGSITALEDVSFFLPYGKYLSLFGRNGAGKTTLLRILATLLKPAIGTIHFGSHELYENVAFIRKMIGFVSHHTMLYGDLTASENLHYYARLYGIENAERVIKEYLERVGLKLWADTSVRGFSKGMQQRLAIARAFINQPKYLLLDEPFAGLDRNAIVHLKSFLQEFHTGEHCAIITTHQLEEGWESGDMAAILDKGKICFFQSTKDISFAEFEKIYAEVQDK